MKNKKILWITQTALLLALTILAQSYVRTLFPANYSQYIVGSLVNLFLILATLLCGLSSGTAISILAPFLAFIMGQIVYPQQIPVVALGNCAIVFAFWFFCISGLYRKYRKNGKFLVSFLLSSVIGSIAKFFVLWLGMTKIFIPLVLNKDSLLATPKLEAMTAAITLNFSYPQLITAGIGCLLAFSVYPPIKRQLIKRQL